ncbi:MAG TPA: hypothetical protein VML91_25295 [Burkholderiales bacterium]|nr:hypothetical protein [Burkholderiales bacterium]
MLATSTYSKAYVDACRSRIALQVSAYENLVAAAKGGTAGSASPVRTAIDALEPLYFGNLLIALDAHFVHRLRAAEGKDGNPLNEVRMLCASMMTNNGVLSADKTINYTPAKAVLKIEVGQPIRFTARGFALLSEAFLAEIERKYR